MTSPKLPTKFASAERASQEDLQRQSREVSTASMLAQIFNAVPGVLAVLNKERQIVFANRSLLDFLEIQDANAICGWRMGEMLGCAHAAETEGGCGTTESCQMCGGIQAILASHQGKTEVRECRIIRKGGDALDLRIHAAPFQLGNRVFTILSISDIGDEKRRKALERIFLQDVLNTARGLQGNAQKLYEDEIEEPRRNIFELSGHLLEDINMQRILTAAESGKLAVRLGDVMALDVLRDVVGYYIKQPIARNRNICIDDACEKVSFKTEKTLLKVVLSHMVKNALEATKPNGTITLGIKIHAKQIEFWVKNAGEMPREVRLQIFQRSFSTKGEGRGLGTYAMKLLSERYLNGQVSFKTSALENTTFRAIYPMESPDVRELLNI